jgi:hypothetical protein
MPSGIRFAHACSHVGGLRRPPHPRAGSALPLPPLRRASGLRKEAGFLNGYEAQGDAIRIDPKPSPSQQRAIAAKATQGKPRLRNAPASVGELLPAPPKPKGRK